MSAYKTAGLVALGCVLVGMAGFALTAEVRAGDDVPVVANVDQDTLAQASAFAGEYTHVGGQKERDGIDAAIEASMDAVSPMLRNIGRKRLQESNQLHKNLTIEIDGDVALIGFDGTIHKATLDGRPLKTSSQGDKVKITHTMRGSKLTQFIDGDQGDRRNTFKLSGDGSRVTVDVEILSSHLPVPVEYRLTFKRK